MERAQPELLAELAAKVEAGWQDVDEDRKKFFEGLRLLQAGQIKEASRVFRRAARDCPEPFDVMARMAQGRCEAVQGREGVALRVFREIANSEAPSALRRLAWMEVADLARQRDDEELMRQALEAVSTADSST